MGAGVAILAGDVAQRVLAVELWVAVVGGAGVAVFAVFRVGADAGAGGAGIGLGADVGVVAVGGVVAVYAALAGVAGVVGARVAVVAAQRRAAFAGLGRARVAVGTGVAVAAAEGVGAEGAAALRVAAIRRADVAVIADDVLDAAALARAASAGHVAFVAVVAFGAVLDVDLGGAFRWAGAVVDGAGVVVVAVEAVTDAFAGFAGRGRSAAAAVVADGRRVDVLAAGGLVASVGRARVGVVAVQRRLAGGAGFGGADVAERAEAAVVAARGVGRVFAAGGLVARVVGARVGVVAVERFAAGLALRGRAGVTDAAGVAVVADGGVRRVSTIRLAGGVGAAVVGAWVGVVAGFSSAAGTVLALAFVVGGAAVAVVAAALIAGAAAAVGAALLAVAVRHADAGLQVVLARYRRPQRIAGGRATCGIPAAFTGAAAFRHALAAAAAIDLVAVAAAEL